MINDICRYDRNIKNVLLKPQNIEKLSRAADLARNQ